MPLPFEKSTCDDRPRCQYCGELALEQLKECNRCWELRTRLEAAPPWLASRFYHDLQNRRNEGRTNKCGECGYASELGKWETRMICPVCGEH